MPFSHRAFSLVELSIVLVILGLLVGGVLSGQSLIRAAQLRSVSTDYAKYYAAGKSFRDRYFALPGDMINATSFCGTADVCPGWQAGSARNDARTCNGDGDGHIVHVSCGGACQNEIFGMWQHLADAGLVEGHFTGITNDPSYGAPYGISFAAGVNSPPSKINNATWGTYYIGTVTIIDTTYVEGDYANAMMFGNAAGGLPYGAALKPEEAWNIDTKIDDGKPGSGAVVVPETNGGNCYNLSDGSAGSASAAAARNTILYNLTYSSNACALIFKNYL